MNKQKPDRKPSGWTLVELALVFIVITLVIGVGAPRMASVLSGAKVKAGEEDLLGVVDAVDQYVIRVGTATTQQSIAWSFDRVTHRPPRQPGGYTVVDPWDILSQVVPGSFTGLNKFDQLYDAYVTVGVEATSLRVLSCVPKSEYQDYQPINVRVSVDCSGAYCGGTYCDMSFVERLVAGRVTEDVSGETNILYTAAG